MGAIVNCIGTGALVKLLLYGTMVYVGTMVNILLYGCYRCYIVGPIIKVPWHTYVGAVVMVL